MSGLRPKRPSRQPPRHRARPYGISRRLQCDRAYLRSISQTDSITSIRPLVVRPAGCDPVGLHPRSLVECVRGGAGCPYRIVDLPLPASAPSEVMTDRLEGVDEVPVLLAGGGPGGLWTPRF